MPTQLFRDYLARVGDGPAGFPVGLLTIANRAGEPLLLFSSFTDRTVLSRGQTFFPAGFDFRFPDRLSEGEARPAFVFQVGDLSIVSAMRAHPTKLSVTFELVFSRTPDVLEFAPARLFDVQRVIESSTQTLSLECGFRDVMRDPRPGRKYTPSAFPGLFGTPNLQGVL